jgi:hypothetical protein
MFIPLAPQTNLGSRSIFVPRFRTCVIIDGAAGGEICNDLFCILQRSCPVKFMSANYLLYALVPLCRSELVRNKFKFNSIQ